MMEPGSTFKIVAAASAVNEGRLRMDSFIFCENGIWNYGGRPLHDHKAFGDLSVQDILVKSSNIGAAKLAMVYLGLLGFLDDYLKVTKKKTDGIPGRVKLLCQLALACIVAAVFLTSPLLEVQARSLYVPFVKAPVVTNMCSVLPAAG